ncbi:MAG TPA: ROK family protein [Solirubrobacteraceae bacterium]|nr:ROK family protein [Solirubrobacteraceae bacterium]
MAVEDSGSRRGTFIGVDVGGTKIAIAAMRDGVLGDPVVIPTETENQQALIAQLEQGIRGAMAIAGERVSAVGLGIPSIIEFTTGRVRTSTNIPLRDVPLREVLEQRLPGIAVFVDNDATCAAIGEAHDESGRLDTPNLVMLTVGTGVGGGIVIDGLPYRGATGAAAELGHTIVGLDLSEGAVAVGAHDNAVGALGEFPRRGSLEALAAGRTLDALALSSARAHPNSKLGQLAASGHQLNGHDVLLAASEGDPYAQVARTLLGERLGVGIANVINTFDPEVVAIGGGVSAAGDTLLETASESAWRFVLPGVGTSTTIRLARRGAEAGVRGAALLASVEVARKAPGGAARERAADASTI